MKTHAIYVAVAMTHTDLFLIKIQSCLISYSLKSNDKQFYYFHFLLFVVCAYVHKTQ